MRVRNPRLHGTLAPAALSEATDALDEVVALYRSDGIPIPSPSDRRTGEYWVAVLPGATTGTPMR